MFITDESVTALKEVTQFIPNLDYIDLASLLAAIAESIRQGQSLGNSLEESNIDIKGITDDGCGLLPHIQDVRDEMELISLATFCTAHLMQAYRCI